MRWHSWRGGNYGQTAFQKLATPVQNNSSIYNVIYTYTKGAWIIQPYFQYTNVPTNMKIGVDKGASTTGGAILLSYAIRQGFLAAGPLRIDRQLRVSGKDGAVNLLYGPGSNGTSFTVTPTYQKGGLFVRSDLGYVHIGSLTPGNGFGQTGNEQGQFRALLESASSSATISRDRKVDSVASGCQHARADGVSALSALFYGIRRTPR